VASRGFSGVVLDGDADCCFAAALSPVTLEEQTTGVPFMEPVGFSPVAAGRQFDVAGSTVVWATAIEGKPSAAMIAAVRRSFVIVVAPTGMAEVRLRYAVRARNG
jgi:hypothetical protein